MKFAFVMTILLAPAFAHATAEITVRSHSLINSGAPVHLGDILEFKGTDQSIQEKLMNVTLAAAPAPGEKLEFTNAAISGFLRTYLNDVAEPPRLHIPNHVTVERSLHKWENGSVTAELVSFWQPMCTDCELQIDRLNLPAGQFEDWKMAPKNELPHGGFSVPVEVSKAGQTATVWLQGNLVVRKRVPVVKRAIGFSERIQADDVDWRWRDVTFAQDGAPSADDITGHRVKTPLRIDDIVFAGNLEHDKALRRGEVARVVSGQGDWQVSITAIAQQDGEIGDTVTVRNPRTNRDMTGVVVAKDEVQIQ